VSSKPDLKNGDRVAIPSAKIYGTVMSLEWMFDQWQVMVLSHDGQHIWNTPVSLVEKIEDAATLVPEVAGASAASS